MKSSNKISSLLFLKTFFLLTAISACGGKKTNNTSSPQSDLNVPTASVVQSTSPDGSVTITQTNTDPAQLQAAQDEYRRANLIQLPVDAKFNANILRITDDTILDYKNKAFIAPRLFAYGTQEGGMLLPIHHDDGTVTLAFNVAFLDGGTNRILDPSANGSSIDLPAIFLVQNADELKTVLLSEYGIDNGVSPLPGCPKKLTVIAAGVEYDATPSNLARGDFCQLNIPVTVSMTVPEEDAKLIMEVELYAHLVDLEGVYETKVSFPTSKVSVSFDRSKIYQDLQAELGIKAYYVDADVKLATTKVMQNQLMKVTVQGETSEFVDQLIDKVTAEFFEAWTPTPDSTQNPCGPTTPVCMRFSSTTQTQSSTLTFDWDESSNLMSGQDYITSTKLKATPNISRIGDVSVNCVSTADHVCDAPLSNHGNARETGLTVADGNQITIEPTYMTIEKKELVPPNPVRQNNMVCVRSHEMCVGANNHPTCQAICDDMENHWSDTTTYTTQDVTVDISEPVGQIDQLFGGLAFRFEWMDQASGKMKSIDCALSDFPREGNGRDLTVRVQNLPTCHPFSGNAGETPMLSLLNRIADTDTYPDGRSILNWDGSVSERPTTESFTPEIGFAGTISIQGYSFISDSSQGSL